MCYAVSDSISTPQHYRTALYSPKPPLLTLAGPLESLRFSFLAPTFLHMDATQEKGFARASSVIFFTSSSNGGSSYEDVFIPRSARNGRLHTFFACICFQFVS